MIPPCNGGIIILVEAAHNRPLSQKWVYGLTCQVGCKVGDSEETRNFVSVKSCQKVVMHEIK